MANDIVIHIKADDDASGKLDQLQGKAGGLGGALGGVLKVGALAGGAAIAGIGFSAIKSAADFEKAMDAVGAVAGATEADMKSLTDEALRIGKETSLSASEAADAMEILAASGLSAKDIFGGAASAAVALAEAGGTNLKTAADTAATSMAVWGLKTSDLTDVVNRLAGAANVSRFGVEDMSMAVAMGGGAAASAGVEFGDFATAIAAIAPSFSSGSDAGTSFKQFLNALTPTTDKAIGVMTQLGLITAEGSNRFFDAAGSLKSMTEITALLHDATKDLTEQQKAQALETIFGSDAMRAAAGIAKLTGEEFAAMDKTMRESDAAAIAKQRMDNFAGSMEALKGSIEAILIELGLKLMPVLQAVAQFLADKLPGAFDAAEKAIKGVVDAVTPFVKSKVIPQLRDAFEQLQQTLPPIAKFFKEHPEALAAVAVVLGILLVALFPIPAAILAIVTAGTLLLANWDEIRELFEVTIPAAIDSVITKIEELPIIGEIFQTTFDNVRAILTAAWDSIKVEVETAINIVRDVIKIVTALIHGDWSEAWEGVKALVGHIWEGIRALIEIHLELIKTLIWNQLQLVVGIVADLWKLGPNSIYNTIVGAMSDAKQFVSDRIDDIVSFFAGLPGRITTALSGLPGALEAAFRAGLNAVIGQINSFIGKFNALSIPGFTIKIPMAPDIKFGGFDFPDIPKVALLAQGGIVRSPTLALLGERGPEAIVPLNGAGGALNSAGGAGMGMTVIFNISALDGESVRRIMPGMVRQLQDHLRGAGLPGLVGAT
ncbi:MAG TPA: phage tail tape measure protein [Dehalococcoidia bacterium]|nr:phage tail tape measure protein [Dehalococcoidia bacterium]